MILILHSSLQQVRDDVLVRVLKERGQWFVEIGADGREWFDARVVLRAIGDTDSYAPPVDEAGVKEFLETLAKSTAKWQVCFHQSIYPTFLKQLHSLETASSKERFGYP